MAADSFTYPDGSDFFNLVTRETSANVVQPDFVAFHAATLTIAPGGTGVRFDNIVISNTVEGVGLRTAPPVISEVPEPATLPLLGLGLAIWAGACRGQPAK